MEWKLFEGETPEVSTPEFHRYRERAPHLEQRIHQHRIYKAIEYAYDAAQRLPFRPVTLSDLGCGDGGLLSVLQHASVIDQAWGYDFQPSNVAGWEERGVRAFQVDIFNDFHIGKIATGNIVVMTEVLEHIANPSNVLQQLAPHCKYIVASSPFTETDLSHDACHAWAWDVVGYTNLFEENGFHILRHESVDMFQVVLAEAK